MTDDTKIFERMHQSMAMYWGAYGLEDGFVFDQSPTDWFLWSGVPHPVMNNISILRYDFPGLSRRADKANDLIQEHGLGFHWWLSPQAVEDKSVEHLATLGFEAAGHVPAMLCNLESFKPPAAPDELRIELAEGPDERALWANVVARGFGFDEVQTTEFTAREHAIPETWLEDQQRYLGFIEDRPVTASSLVMAAGFAGIYAVATLEDSRNSGLGSAMTVHAMNQGREQGANEAVLQSSDMGRPIYERLGFSEVFRYSIYLQS